MTDQQIEKYATIVRAVCLYAGLLALVLYTIALALAPFTIWRLYNLHHQDQDAIAALQGEVRIARMKAEAAEAKLAYWVPFPREQTPAPAQIKKR